MTPTHEQVAAWALEAGMQDLGRGFTSFKPLENSIIGGQFVRPTLADLQTLVTRAFTEGRVYQAEQDAKVCSQVGARETAFEAIDCAAAIRANAPKVTT